MPLHARIDVNLATDPRVLRAGQDAELLYIRAILFAKAQLSDGAIDSYQLPLIAAGIRGKPAALAAKLVEVGLWEATETGWRVPAAKWAKWQTTAAEVEEKRRSTRERVTAYRIMKRNGNAVTGEPVTALHSGTPKQCNTTSEPEPEPEPEKNTLRSGESPPAADPSPPQAEKSTKPAPSPAEFLAAWNDAVPFAKARTMSAKRERALAARRADRFWAEHWAEALSRIASSAFLRGENERSWRCDIEWFLKPDSVAKLVEGRYDAGDRKPLRRGDDPGRVREADFSDVRETRAEWVDSRRLGAVD